MDSKPGNIYDQLVFWASIAAYSFLFLFILASFMPGSVLHIKDATPRFTATLYPAKWDFYTGSAMEPQYRMYRIADNKIEPYDIRPFTGRFLFGLKRDGKIIVSELEMIATDTPFVTGAWKYNIQMPANGDINNYIHADTLKYNTYRSENVLYLKGQLVLGIESSPTWQQRRAAPGPLRNITLIPLNLGNGK